jgi:hypothetical protein
MRKHRRIWDDGSAMERRAAKEVEEGIQPLIDRIRKRTKTSLSSALGPNVALSSSIEWEHSSIIGSVSTLAGDA